MPSSAQHGVDPREQVSRRGPPARLLVQAGAQQALQVGLALQSAGTVQVEAQLRDHAVVQGVQHHAHLHAGAGAWVRVWDHTTPLVQGMWLCAHLQAGIMHPQVQGSGGQGPELHDVPPMVYMQVVNMCATHMHAHHACYTYACTSCVLHICMHIMCATHACTSCVLHICMHIMHATHMHAHHACYNTHVVHATACVVHTYCLCSTHDVHQVYYMCTTCATVVQLTA